jgi:hypothetical protein
MMLRTAPPPARECHRRARFSMTLGKRLAWPVTRDEALRAANVTKQPELVWRVHKERRQAIKLLVR